MATEMYHNPKFLILLFLAILPGMGSAVSQPVPPSIRCISVETNGDVTLTYTAPADTGTVFTGYHFYFATSLTGPFSLIDSVLNYNALSHTITGVNASAASLAFYVRTREGCCSWSVSSDTLRSMRMIVTSLSNEAVRLNWNRIHTPPLGTTLSNFTVSKELTTGTFTNFKTTLDTVLNDTNVFCSRFINYKVTQGDLSGCLSVSSVDGELFRDNKGPAKPLIDTVSINQLNGNVQISWFPDSSADTEGYVIYQFNGTSYDSIGSVTGINNVFFNYSLTQSDQVVESYSVSAYDSCNNLGPLAANHSTMLLSLGYVKCTAEASLTWTPYVNMNNGLQRYEVWMRVNGGPWVRDGFVPSTVSGYEKTLTVQGAAYEFYIRALGTDGQTASSNIISVVADLFEQPQYLYLRSASVTGSSVTVKCFVDDTADVISYRLYRGSSAGGPFTLVGSVPYSITSTITFNDLNSNADEEKVFYKVTATDSCGLEQIESNVASTVFLAAEGGNDFISELNWLDYSGWQSGSGYFNIYRVVNGMVNGNPFATVGGDTLHFTEDVSSFPGEGDNFCYTVQAVEDSVNAFGFRDSAMSNIACAPQAASVYIPNAFTPKGKNPVFKPYILFGDPTSYSLKIYNRWGQEVFTSDDPSTGWDGKFNGNDSEQGIYIYMLVFKGYNKKEVRRNGIVTLVR